MPMCADTGYTGDRGNTYRNCVGHVPPCTPYLLCPCVLIRGTRGTEGTHTGTVWDMSPVYPVSAMPMCADTGYTGDRGNTYRNCVGHVPCAPPYLLCPCVLIRGTRGTEGTHTGTVWDMSPVYPVSAMPMCADTGYTGDRGNTYRNCVGHVPRVPRICYAHVCWYGVHGGQREHIQELCGTCPPVYPVSAMPMCADNKMSMKILLILHSLTSSHAVKKTEQSWHNWLFLWLWSKAMWLKAIKCGFRECTLICYNKSHYVYYIMFELITNGWCTI